MIGTLALFVVFGLLIGVLFGFFGMGGSFLVTPALLILGYPAPVAVGSGMAFVFGTAVIAALKHREMGQVDAKLGFAMLVGTALGIEGGKGLVLYLEGLGLAGGVIGGAYVVLLGGVGVFTLRDAFGEGGASLGSGVGDVLQRVEVWPMLEFSGGVRASLWVTLGVGGLTGFLAGFLGVGGGFILMPALVYGLGVPVTVAVGTDLFQIVFSGGYGAFRYAMVGAVDLWVVVPLLAGSALGAILGARWTRVVDSEEIKEAFGLMLVGGAVAVASRQVGVALGVGVLEVVGLVLIFGSALLVAGWIGFSVWRASGG